MTDVRKPALDPIKVEPFVGYDDYYPVPFIKIRCAMSAPTYERRQTR